MFNFFLAEAKMAKIEDFGSFGTILFGTILGPKMAGNRPWPLGQGRFGQVPGPADLEDSDSADLN